MILPILGRQGLGVRYIGAGARCRAAAAFDELVLKGDYLATLCGSRPLRHIMLQLSLGHVGFLSGSFGSAADVLDCEAGEEHDSAEAGFGLGDGYYFGATAWRKSLFEGVSDETAAGVAVEADAVEV